MQDYSMCIVIVAFICLMTSHGRSDASSPEVCLTSRTKAKCTNAECSRPYRTYDGTCNNEENRLWGASETPFKRLLPPAYEDNVTIPIGWDSSRLYNGHPKPNARKVSLEIMSTEAISKSDKFTDLVMVWGQFLDHDTDLTPKTDSHCTSSCQQESPYCFPVFAPENDPRLEAGGCIAVTRSTRVCDLEPRRQLNSITSYIDASLVYGSTVERALDLRELNDNSGCLKVGASVDDAGGQQSKPLMPFTTPDFPQACALPLQEDSGIPCFFAGDVRANEHLGLTALHTLFVREHNRIAGKLASMNHQWNGETLYQESRKIVGALMQIISYEHWLPKIIGTVGMELLGAYMGYNNTVDASTANSFATAYFRFGHAQISPRVSRVDSTFGEDPNFGNLDLHDAAFCPHRIVNEGSIDGLLRGMYSSELKKVDPQEIMSDEVTNHLFELARPVAHDLASLNIQRGRDHGLPGYNDWRDLCGMPEANTFAELENDITDETLRQRLQELYGHPANVDLFVGGLVEDPWQDSLLGETFTRLLVKQFQSFRDGDRFWYENPNVFNKENNPIPVFTPAQLQQLKKHSLGRIFCDSGDYIGEVQTDVFEYVGPYSDGLYKLCTEIPAMDLKEWKDESNTGPPSC